MEESNAGGAGSQESRTTTDSKTRSHAESATQSITYPKARANADSKTGSYAKTSQGNIGTVN